MNLNKLIKNLGYAFLAQGSSLLASLLTTFLIPKILGITEYGYFQLYIFYSTYIGLFHFGVNDGVYLIFGGIKRLELDKSDIKSQMLVITVVQIFLASLIVCVSPVFEPVPERVFVLVIFGISIPITNMTTYLGYVFQACNETKLFSISCMLSKIFYFVLVAVLLVFRCEAFEPYVIAGVMSQFISLIYCLAKGLDILCARTMDIKVAIRNVVASLKVGIKLTLANIASILVLGFLRYSIDQTWGIEEFGIVSLSLTLVSFVSSFINQAAMVLFPALRMAGLEETTSFFIKLRDVLGAFLPVCFIFYFPICIFVNIWLPDYADSVRYLALLLPICLFDSEMSLMGTTFLKVLRKETSLLLINIAAVALSVVFISLAIYLINSIELAIVASVVVISLRSIFTSCYVSHLLECDYSSIIFGEITLSIIFMTTAWTLMPSASFCVMLPCYIAFLLIFRRCWQTSCASILQR